MQSRKDQVLKVALICLAIYTTALLLTYSSKLLRDYLLTLPGYLLMSYGCYCLISIGRSTESITEHEDEFVKLQKEIQEAKKFIEANNLG